ncbi:lysozyme [Streptomyces sp. NBC_01317]|uniref:lysozyme n=1 Tax=Streptomyces sp. NBC_01317 TaxID=2903822 RepID=UPI002E1174D6|nr:lysozyme [Streptomyces sp. NBC_01317]
MPKPRSTTTGRLLRSTAATLLAVPPLLLTLPATATSAAPEPVPPTRGSAHMGTGVLAHEGGGGGLPASLRAAQTEGVDVSSHQKDVDWAKLWDSGVKWAYVKATEGSYYKNPYFGQQYEGSYNTGMIRGAYHFAAPDDSGGAEQATYFADGGGTWSSDGRTLPGVLDIEWNPYGAACYGKTPAQLVSWIRDFLTTYKTRTGRAALIYTSTKWWRDCTDDYAGFGTTNPLWIARYDTTVGELPAGWEYQTIWQYTSSGPTVGDHNKFNGPLSGVKSLATG